MTSSKYLSEIGGSGSGRFPFNPDRSVISSDNVIDINSIDNSIIKADIVTPSESILFYTAVLLLSSTLLFINAAGKNPEFLKPVFVLVAAAAILGLVRKNTDNYYVFNTSKRSIELSIRCFNFKRRKHICSFNDIFCVILNPGRQSYGRRYEHVWVYSLALLLKNGSLINISEYGFYTGSPFIAVGQNIAEKLGVPFIAGRGDHFIKIKNRPVKSENDIGYRLSWAADLLIIFKKIAGVVVILPLLVIALNYSVFMAVFRFVTELISR